MQHSTEDIIAWLEKMAADCERAVEVMQVADVKTQMLGNANAYRFAAQRLRSPTTLLPANTRSDPPATIKVTFENQELTLPDAIGTALTALQEARRRWPNMGVVTLWRDGTRLSSAARLRPGDTMEVRRSEMAWAPRRIAEDLPTD